MARQPKTGLNYFAFDVDFFDDPRICALTADYGTAGQAAVVALLCAIYRNGYYLEWSPECCVTLLKNLPGVGISKMEKIIRTLVEWDFFDKDLFRHNQVLTSSDIQQRFLVAARRRKYASHPTMPYWLAEKQSDRKPETEAKPVAQAETPIMSSETPEMSSETPTKENRKNNNKIIISPSSTTRTQEAVRQIRKNQTWMEAVCMRHHLDKDELSTHLDEFALDCECRGKPEHESLSDVQSHFCNWLLIRLREQQAPLRQSSRQSTVPQQSSYHQIQDNIFTSNYHARHHHQSTSADYIAEAQHWAIERTMAVLQSPKRGGQGLLEDLPF